MKKVSSSEFHHVQIYRKGVELTHEDSTTSNFK